jgi:alpha-mannosidase
VQLKRDNPLIEIHTEFDNQASDHMLCALFPVSFEDPHDFSQIAFDEVVHDDTLFDFRADLKSTQSVLHPMEGYAGLRGARGSVAVTTRGLYEYHTKKHPAGKTLYLTLLRSTGWMFHGLPHNWLDGQASTTPLLETPEARELGKNVFDYALIFDSDSLLKFSEQFRYPPRCYTMPAREAACKARKPQYLLPDFSLGDERIGLSAVKKWRHGDGLIVRLFNSSGEKVSFQFGAGSEIARVRFCDLLENPGEDAVLKDGVVSLTVNPRKIITLILYRREADHE